jgi:ADP-ribose pyrophosphatase YjhB (NUDIX family)
LTTFVRDTFCSYCGTRHIEATYPRTCPGCKTQLWSNPVHVVVPLVDDRDERGPALLVIRRAIPPVGMLALPGGFLEDHESWQVGAAREVREETSLDIDPNTLTPMWFASGTPKPNRLLVFSVAAPVATAALPPFRPDSETAERGVIFGPGGIDEVFAFSLHVEAVRRYFAERGIDGSHAYTQR